MKKVVSANKEERFKDIYLMTFDKLSRIFLRSLKDKELVHDALQEAYLKLWVKLDEQEQQQDHIPFLYFYARHYAQKQIVRNIKREFLTDELFRENDKVDMERELDYHEYTVQLHQVIDRFPPKRREVYRLFKEEGLSYQSIGEKLQISCKTVDNHLSKAAKTIKKEIHSIYGISKLIIALFCLLADNV